MKLKKEHNSSFYLVNFHIEKSLAIFLAHAWTQG